jgi:hypothetical protein
MTVVTSTPIDAGSLDTEFTRADIEFHGLDHTTASYEGRVFLNKPDANASTPFDASEYAGSYFIFGHGGCLGDVGHCDVIERRPFDPRPPHPLTPTRKALIATAAVRRALDALAGRDRSQLTITVVPVVLSTTTRVGRPDDLVSYDRVQIITYR